MGITIETFVLGAIENNTYLIFSSETNEAVLIDPAVPSRKIVEFISENSLIVEQDTHHPRSFRSYRRR